MKISELETYKLVEHANGICIIPARGSIPGAYELIIADTRSILIYLNRYLSERKDGKSIQESHAVAIRGATSFIDTFPRG